MARRQQKNTCHESFTTGISSSLQQLTSKPKFSQGGAGCGTPVKNCGTPHFFTGNKKPRRSLIYGVFNSGGRGRNRTGVGGFAIHCITILLLGLKAFAVSSEQQTRTNWSGKRDSNSRPRPWQGRALPTELFPLGDAHSIELRSFVNPLIQKSFISFQHPSSGAARRHEGIESSTTASSLRTPTARRNPE